ncbi:MAG: ECF transporter S component [Oscillospiraceae bacterium]|nr:ECF transporter S component [Oscillospiraceae bacterium]
MRRDTLSQSSRIRSLTQFSILLAIEAVFCFTPLGSIPIGPMVATLMYVPVIIAAILLGTRSGAAMGFFSGLFSFIVWTFMPPSPLAFVFTPFYSVGDLRGNGWSLVICFVPRVMVGVAAGALYKLFEKRKIRPVISCALSGVLGGLTATVLVLGGIYVFFGQPYASANDIAYSALLGALAVVAATNGLLEAAIAGIVGAGVCVPLKKILNGQG